MSFGKTGTLYFFLLKKVKIPGCYQYKWFFFLYKCIDWWCSVSHNMAAIFLRAFLHNLKLLFWALNIRVFASLIFTNEKINVLSLLWSNMKKASYFYLAAVLNILLKRILFLPKLQIRLVNLTETLTMRYHKICT